MRQSNTRQTSVAFGIGILVLCALASPGVSSAEQLTACAFLDAAASRDTSLWCESRKICEAGIMAECGGAYFCPTEYVLREDMAVHLERALHGSTVPVPTPSQAPRFTDVPYTYGMWPWIEQLALDGITLGYGTIYKPHEFVPRLHMAVFIARTIRAKYGVAIPNDGMAQGKYYNCLSGPSLFADSDLEPGDGGCAEVHFLYARCVTGGCTTSPNPLRFCAADLVRRDQMAAFLWRAFVSDAPSAPTCPQGVPSCT